MNLTNNDCIDVYVIGCGGIGGYVIDRLPMVLASLSLDILEGCGADVPEMLKHFGERANWCIADRLVLVDGDVFEPRNALRQGMAAGSKLAQRMLSVKDQVDGMRQSAGIAGPVAETLDRLAGQLSDYPAVRQAMDRLLGRMRLTSRDMDNIRRSVIMASALQEVRLEGHNAYLKPENTLDIIPPGRHRSVIPVVFVCVDNLKTRYEISRYMERFDRCLVVNGGNSRTDGHVTVYERYGGLPLDPNLYEVYDNVRPDADLRPDETPCTEVAPKHDQIAVTNSIIADLMLARFIEWARNGLYDGGQQTATVRKRYNDIHVDICKPSMMPLYHPVSKQQAQGKEEE